MPCVAIARSSRCDSPFETIGDDHIRAAARPHPAYRRRLRENTRSVGYFRVGAQFVRGGAAIAEEFEIGGDLLEQHVGPDETAAAASGGGPQQRGRLRSQYH